MKRAILALAGPVTLAALALTAAPAGAQAPPPPPPVCDGGGAVADVLYAVNGVPIVEADGTTPASLTDALADAQPGNNLSITWTPVAGCEGTPISFAWHRASQPSFVLSEVQPLIVGVVTTNGGVLNATVPTGTCEDPWLQGDFVTGLPLDVVDGLNGLMYDTSTVVGGVDRLIDKGYSTDLGALEDSQDGCDLATPVQPEPTPERPAPTIPDEPEAPLAPAPTVPASTTTTTVVVSDPLPNCPDLEAQGIHDIARGDLNYRPELDGDDDGVACETSNGNVPCVEDCGWAGNALPFTGSRSGDIARGGIAFVAAGLLMVMAARRWRLAPS